MNKTLFLIWFGGLENMSVNRKKCLDSIYQHAGIDIVLINEDNLNHWLVEPLHPAFEYLSLTHKADYLRSYLMYFYGGAYTDIKINDFNWLKYFDDLEKSDKEINGYPELEGYGHGFDTNYLIGNCLYIFKKNSIIAHEWYNTVKNILDAKLDTLKENPGTYHPRACVGGIAYTPNENTFSYAHYKYPIRWEEIHGELFHKVQYNHKHLILRTMPTINTNNYI